MSVFQNPSEHSRCLKYKIFHDVFYQILALNTAYSIFKEINAVDYDVWGSIWPFYFAKQILIELMITLCSNREMSDFVIDPPWCQLWQLSEPEEANLVFKVKLV